MSGMLRSSRMTANSRLSTSASASEPERAMTRFCPSSSSMVRKASSFSGRSSTIRMLALSPCPPLGSTPVILLPIQPPAQHGEQVQPVHGLGEVVPRACLDALHAVALHGLRGHGDDRQVLAARQLADLL